MKKLTTRQKILVGLVAAGLAAVARERLQDTSSVTEAQAQTAGNSPVAAEPVAAPAASLAASRDPLDLPCKKAMVDHLKAACAASAESRVGEARDAFCPPPAWMPSKPVQAEAAARKPSAEAFLRSHALQGILIRGPSKDVIINNRCVRVGQTIDGFKLVRVEDSRAVLVSSGDDSVTVELLQKNDLQNE
jgi:hypothetical protein